jgi:alpha-mannosidase
MNRTILTISSLLAAHSALTAAPVIKAEQLKPTDPAWKFKTIPGPSKSDVAQNALIAVTAGGIDNASARPDVLANGKLPANPKDLTQCVLFASVGTLVIDLGKPQSVAAVDTYSWHEFPDDQGARGPQVYTLYGAAVENQWVKIADVDTRPNKTGESWNGQHGASVTDSTGKLGDFRFLKFEIQPTYSPKQSNPVWTHTLFSEIDVHTVASLAKAGDATIAEPTKVTDVWVVIKSHFDIGFTDQVENVLDRYRVEMMDKSLAVMAKNRELPENKRFTWTVPGWPLDAVILGPKQDPARKVKIEQAIKEGALAVHALSSSTHTESLDLENLVRSLGYSSHIARTYGRPLPTAAKMTDVPSHSWIMPTLLEHAGVKFLHLGCNPASQFPRVPQLFWWQGADGSRVLCGYTHDYGSSLTPPANWPAKNYLAMIAAGDNHGPPSPEEVEKMRQQLATSMPGVNVHFGTLDDFAKAILIEKPDLPLVRGDMPDTWIHGLLSNPISTKSHRNTQALEPALDALDTQLRLWGEAPAPLAAPLAKAYEQSLLYGEHTWGMNAEYGPRRQYGEDWKKWLEAMEKEPIPADGDYTKIPRGSKRKWMQSYQDHRDYAFNAEKIVTPALQSRMTLLASSVKAQAGSVVVYNPLPWKRSGIVEANGKRLFAKDVPASGYLTLTPQADQTEQSDATTLDTSFFKATFDLERGAISSLIEKSTGRELADKSSPYALGQFLHERFSTKEVFDRFFSKYSRIQGSWGLADIGKPGMPPAEQVPYFASTPGGWKLNVERSATEDRAILTASDSKGLAKGHRLTFTFPRRAAWVDVEWQVADKTADKHPEGGWLCFPFAVENPRFTIGRPGAPIDPAKDIVPGSNRHLMAVASGVSITGADSSGAALCPIDSPLVSLDKPGLWWWTMDFVPTKPSVFVNLYNNMWNTNFPLWQEGSWSERVRIWPVAKDTNTTQDLAVQSWEARVPLLAALATGKGPLPAEQAGLTVSRPGVLVTAFGENPDGKGTVLRVWDQSGGSGDLTITVPGKFTKATPVDLRGENPGKPLPVRDGKLTIPLKAYAPASFILE